ncbi:hypothetical protein ACFLQY_04365 [Verrucomicrobiota bacterium]
MKKGRLGFGVSLIFFVVLAILTFRCVWGENLIFSASDVNIGGLAFRKRFGLDLLFGYFNSNPVLGGASSNYSLFNSLAVLFPLHLFADCFYPTVLVLGSLFLVWFLRLWGRSWTASIFGGVIAFWLNSITLSAAGHVYKMEVLVLSVLSLCFIEKSVRAESVRKSVGYAVFAGLSVGLMMLEQQDVALLAGLFVGPYAVFRLIQRYSKNALRWSALLIPVAVVSLLFAGPAMVKSYNQNIRNAAQVQGAGEERWNYVTQWSMVPSEWPDLIASGWSGWSTGNPDGPYWGRLGQSAEWKTSKQGFRNFKLTSNYIGIIPFLFGVFGFYAGIRSRKSEEGAQILFWSLAGLCGFVLAFGKYSPLYKLFYELPLMGNIRAPIKLLDNFQICLAVVASFGLDLFLRAERRQKMIKGLWAAALVCGGIFVVSGIKVSVFSGAWESRFTAWGFASHSTLLLKLMAGAWFHAAALVFLTAVAVFLGWKRGGAFTVWAGRALILLLAIDSLLLTSHYFEALDITGLKKTNPAQRFIMDHQGNERVFLTDTAGLYNRWSAIDRSYHGMNLFNIWQMNRMPSEYKAFLGVVGRNQLRLWELSSVRYVVAPMTILEQIKPNPYLAQRFQSVFEFQVPTARGPRQDVILELKGHIPRFALYANWTVVPVEKQCSILASSQHDPQKTVLLSADCGLKDSVGGERVRGLTGSCTSKNARVTLKADTHSILRFSQRYQAGWRVFVDGKEQPLLKVDFLCMGVSVPPGEHTVEFRCPRNRQPLILIVVAGLSLVSGRMLVVSKRNQK